MVQPIDYFGLMGGAGNIGGVTEAVQNALFAQQKAQANALALQKEMEAQERAKQFKADFTTAVTNPNPQTIPTLFAKYPEFSEQLKAGLEGLKTPARDAQFRLALNVHNLIANGEWDGAADLLAQHRDADANSSSAFAPGADWSALIQQIRDRSPAALGMAAIAAASIYPDKYAENYKALNPVEGKSPNQREYAWRVQQFGKPAADKWLTTEDTKLVPVQPGGSVYAYGPDDAGSGTVPAPSQSAPSALAQPQTGPAAAEPRRNQLTYGQFNAYAEVQGSRKAGEWAKQYGLTIEVQNIGEARRLPPGVRYTTPDGKVFIR